MLKHSGKEQQRPSRFQRHAPASIQVKLASNYVSEWKMAIPLLSPLFPVVHEDGPVENALKEDLQRDCQSSSKEKKPISQTWQHPAAPFHYGSPPIMPAFVPKATM
ncbi:hypothetical protein CKAN_00799300 [Cinnamomum micranthum f. kanehirae]|uniref:Uncharacterized protein n=1 Tax=Cinnamomum micranthum f. kanehirae TaxID=337451 RepID=A0A3S3M9C6_9MAGN|nr:hypothetical protein CKAN_00799300 [Cinnamomum micranthum f. kanehirae]